MSRPVVGTFAEQIYESLAPLTAPDEDLGWPLLLYCEAIGLMYQEIEDLVRDSDYGPGWAAIMDSAVAPAKFLPWLGQLVGVTFVRGQDNESQRFSIQQHTGWDRGTISAIKNAARSSGGLNSTGAVVVIEERTDSAYTFTVNTYTSQTVDADLVEAALIAAKPAGLVMTYTVLDGQTYSQALTAAGGDSYDESLLAADGATYNQDSGILPGP